MSQLNVDDIYNNAGTGNPNLPVGVKVTGVTTFLGSQTGLKVTGISTFAGGDIHIDGTAAGVTSAYWDASADSLIFKDNSYAKFGNGSDFSIYHDGTNNILSSAAGPIKIQGPGSNAFTVNISARPDKETIICYNNTNAPYVELYYNNSKKLETTNTGAVITGIATATTQLEVGSTIQAQAASGIITATQFIPTDGQIANRNMVINGDMQVSQRGTQVTGLTASAYATVDRFKFIGANGGTYTCDTVSDSVDNGLRKAFKFTCTTADNAGQSNLANADGLIGCEYRFEGQDVQRIQKGFSSAKQVTLSFWVKSNLTGTYNVELKDVDNSRNCGFTYTVSSSATWEKKTITFPADTTGTMGNDTGQSLTIQWWLAAGNNYRTGGSAQTTWGSTTKNKRAYNNVNLSTATSNYWEITGVQLEVGPVATPFEFQSYGDTLARCQRYYQQWKRGYLAGNSVGTSDINIGVPLTVPLRAAPSIDGLDMHRSGNKSATVSIVSVEYSDVNSIVLEVRVGGWTGGNAVVDETAYVIIPSGATMKISAEL